MREAKLGKKVSEETKEKMIWEHELDVPDKIVNKIKEFTYVLSNQKV